MASLGMIREEDLAAMMIVCGLKRVRSLAVSSNTSHRPSSLLLTVDRHSRDSIRDNPGGNHHSQLTKVRERV
jgi:hypothetical protein